MTLIVSQSILAIQLLMLMQGIDQFTINAREIDIFLSSLYESEFVYKICHGSLFPCKQSFWKSRNYVLAYVNCLLITIMNCASIGATQVAEEHHARPWP